MPAGLLGGFDAYEPTKGFIQEQNRKISEKASRSPCDQEHRTGWWEEEIERIGPSLVSVRPQCTAYHDDRMRLTWNGVRTGLN
jgi:hypothetical protein